MELHIQTKFLGKDGDFKWEYFENGDFDSKTISKTEEVFFENCKRHVRFFAVLLLGTLWIQSIENQIKLKVL